MIKLAIGFDVGHGECAASWVRLFTEEGLADPNSKIERLKVDKDYHTTPSCFVYNTKGHVIYGRDAYKIDTVIPTVESLGFHDVSKLTADDKMKIEEELKKVKLYKNFKMNPDNWDKQYGNSNEEEPKKEERKEKTYRELMHDFIGAVFSQIKKTNLELASISLDEIALYVGCPSNKEWTDPSNRAKYEELIRKATGVKEVHVVPESTAAAFSALKNAKRDGKKIDPWQGIIVFDSGSSTFDETYVQIGKVKFERSWTLGASAIEKAIREKALRDELTDEDLEHIWGPDATRQEMEVRETIKEAYYGTDAVRGFKETGAVQKIIQYIKQDDYQNILLQNKAGHPAAKKEMVSPVINTDFMDSIIEKVKVSEEVRDGFQSQPSRSWREHCRVFFEKSKAELDHNKLPYKTIILTGGGSNMDFIEAECRNTFGNEAEIICDNFPSFCVADGLCQIARNNFDAEPLIKAKKEKLPDQADSTYNDCRENLAVFLTNAVYDITIDVLKSYTKYQPNNFLGRIRKEVAATTVGELRRKIDAYAKKEMRQPFFINKIKQIFAAQNKNTIKEAAEMASDILKQLYDEDIVTEFDIKNDSNGTSEFTKNVIPISEMNNFESGLQKAVASVSGIIASVIVAIVIMVILGVLGIAVPGGKVVIAGFLFFLDDIAKTVEKWVNERQNFPIPRFGIQQALNKAQRNPIKFKTDNIYMSARSAAERILEEVYGKEPREKIKETMGEMLDKSIRFLTFEEFERVL